MVFLRCWIKRYKTYILILLCTILLSCTTPLVLGTQRSLEQARSADSLVDSMGICMHLYHVKKVYYKAYDSIIKPRLLELGIRHVRDGANIKNKTYHSRVNELGRSGIKFNFVTSKNYDLSKLVAFASKVSDGIESFEGLNEWDLVGGATWAKDVRAHQQALYSLIKSNSLMAKFPVIGPSVVRRRSFKQLGDLSAFVDCGNIHSYPGGWNPGISNYKGINFRKANATRNSGSKPIIATETGYHNAMRWKGAHPTTSEAVAGKYVPRLFLEHFNRDILRTYNYEFIDQGTNQSDREQNFGLLRNDGSPKPAYTALKNLIGLLTDPGPSFSLGSLGYTLSGNTSDVHRTLLQKRDGRFYLILWVEKPCYNPDTKELITVPSQQVNLTLHTQIAKAVTYLPNTSTNATIRDVLTQRISKQKLVLSVPDHPLVVELTPASRS